MSLAEPLLASKGGVGAPVEQSDESVRVRTHTGPEKERDGGTAAPDEWPYIAQFIFFFMYPVLSKGAKNDGLKFNDIPALSTADVPHTVAHAFLRRYRVGDSLMRTVHSMYWPRWWWSGFLLFVCNVGSLFVPYIIQELLTFLDSTESRSNPQYAYGLAAALFAASLAQGITIHRFWWESTRVGLWSQISLTTATLAKVLQLSNRSRATITRGRIMNHMAIDACRMNDNFVWPMLHWNTWSAALTVGVTLWNLFMLLGVAGIIGAVAMALLLPFSTLLARFVKSAVKEVQHRRDARGKLITEAIHGIQTLRTYGWTDWFIDKVFRARDLEMVASRRKQYLGVLADFVGTSTPLVIMAGTFALYSALNPNKPLTPAVAFSAIAWILGLQFPLRAVPVTITTLVDTMFSLRRLRNLFGMEEADMSFSSEWASHAGTRAASSATAQQPCDASSIPIRSGAAGDPPARLPPTKLGLFYMAGQNLDGQRAITRATRAAAAIEFHNAVLAWWVAKRLQSAPKNATGANETVGSASEASEEFENSEAPDEDTELPAPELRVVTQPITFSCATGSLTLLVGPVGAGKSTLLSALAGDAVCAAGLIRINGAVAYVSQSPWVLNRTLRENIVFTSDYRSGWYLRVARACGLDVDGESLKGGHDTLVGDAGVTLSGGQKQRVALARAVYADADTYILDDVLSAVDAVVGAHIWEHCIVDLLVRRGKTVLCATHALHFASRRELSQIVVLDAGGAVRGCGTYEDMKPLLQVTGTATQPHEILASTVADTARCDLDSVEQEVRAPPEPMLSSELVGVVPIPGLEEYSETYAHGKVQLKHIWRYLRAFGSRAFLFALLMLYVATQALTIGVTWFMTQWTTSDASNGGSNAAMAAVPGSVELARPGVHVGSSDLSDTTITGKTTVWFAGVYGALNGGLALIGLVRMLMLSYGSIRAGTKLHNAALTSVFQAPAVFFARNPAGRVLNRFLSDMATIDDTVRSSISSFAMQVFTLVGVLAVIAYTTPFVLIFVAAFSYFYYHLANLYRKSARDLRRMQSTAKSPILSGFAEVLRGVPVIRAFGPNTAAAFIDRHLRLCRNHARAFMAYWSANEFISTWMEGLGALIILCACMFAVYQHSQDRLTTAEVGFAVNFALQIPGVLMWLIRFATLVETDAVSVERLVEYIDLEHEEVACKLPAPPSDTPATIQGSPANESARMADAAMSVDARDIELQYAPNLPPVLTGLSMHIPAGAKVAIVGRTGAGKSTLLQVILRMYPYQRGSLYLRSSSVAGLSCAQTRDLLCALLQDPFLFSGDLRENLLGPDARRASNDGLIHDVLHRVGLDERILRLPHGLGANVEEAGSNFSVGERALLSLARSLLRYELRHSARGLLVCDEPTASVDPTTDAIVHDTLLRMPCTVICICHRLQYVPRFDMVAVIDGGRCAEIGPPARLLEDPSSRYSALHRAAAAAHSVAQ